ncbi:MAG TPA: ribokinase [Phycisphaerae bacterium]|nr:ribokinase [Phycisphaerae bacterium]
MGTDSRNGVVVVGSINMDLVVKTDRIPRPGETVLGGEFSTIPGGKGANQAVAVARLGETSTMIGRVGDDPFGRQLIAGLAEANVAVDHVSVTNGVSSGVALIVVDTKGENAICVAPGANQRLMPEDIDANEDVLASAKVCLMQLEVPIATVLRTIALCRRHGVMTILDVAPARPDLPDEIYQADILSPNASEAEMLTGESTGVHAREAKAVAAALAAAGARCVVLKLGAAGALAFDGDRFYHAPGHKVAVVDTTAAGDAFTGALAVACARGEPLPQAIRYANAAGALACTRLGAQRSMPGAAEVNNLLGP